MRRAFTARTRTRRGFHARLPLEDTLAKLLPDMPCCKWGVSARTILLPEKTERLSQNEEEPLHPQDGDGFDIREERVAMARAMITGVGAAAPGGGGAVGGVMRVLLGVAGARRRRGR